MLFKKKSCSYWPNIEKVKPSGHTDFQLRLAKRREYFKTMDKDNNGLISFSEWLNYAHKHILEKVGTM